MGQKIITINGRNYDAHTGMPVDDSSEPSSATKPAVSAPARPHTPHSSVHNTTTQKSHTLNRRVVKNDIAPRSHHQNVQKSPMVSKFASHPSGFKQHIIAQNPHVAVHEHPIVAKTNQTLRQQKTIAAPKPSQIIKQEAIAEAMKQAPVKHEKNDVRPKKKRFSRFASIASASLALLLLGGYFTYLNMPSLSVRVAAAQAGLNASYPEYKPDGYKLTGPIAYSEGQVSIKFAANAGPQNYTIDQSKSSWDSSAVLDNYVKKKAGENYIIYNERGLTIYTFDGNAAWVNGGILYTISGDAPLSSDQIRRIATSM